MSCISVSPSAHLKAFHYMSGEEVKVGDRVREVGRCGLVTEVFQLGSDSALGSDSPEGGVRVVMDWDGKKSNVLWEPPDGDCWEDLEFLGRSS